MAKTLVIIAIKGAAFILTMRNVNFKKNKFIQTDKLPFILTMRNVNVGIGIMGIMIGVTFILTMRNVNLRILNIR